MNCASMSPARKLRRLETPDTLSDYAHTTKRRRDESDGGCVLADLPSEVLLHIFYYIPTCYLIDVRQVCKSWNNLCCDISLWKLITPKKRLTKTTSLFKMLQLNPLVLSLSHTKLFEPHKLAFQELLNSVPNSLRLTHLDVGSCCIQTHLLNDILARCEKLTKICLSHAMLDEETVRLISRQKNLTHLHIPSTCGLTWRGLALLFQSCTRLTHINLSSIHISNSEDVSCNVHEVLRSLPTCCLELDLSYFPVTIDSEGMDILTTQCKSLSYIDLSSSISPSLETLNMITSGWSGCLQVLVLNYVNSNLAISELSMLRECKSLRFFSLQHVKEKVAEGVKKLLSSSCGRHVKVINIRANLVASPHRHKDKIWDVMCE